MLLGKRTGQSRILALFAVLTLLLTTLLGSCPWVAWAEEGAAVYTWTGDGGNASWANPGNWNLNKAPGNTPGVSDEVAVIPPGPTVNLNEQDKVTVCLKNEGNLDIALGAEIHLQPSSELKGGAIQGDGHIYVEGTGVTSWSAGTISRGTLSDGMFMVQSGAILQVTGANMSLDRNITNGGTVKVNASSLEFTKGYGGIGRLDLLGNSTLVFSGNRNFAVNGPVGELDGSASFCAQDTVKVIFKKAYNVANTHIGQGATVTWEQLDARQLGLVSVEGTANFKGAVACNQLQIWQGGRLQFDIGAEQAGQLSVGSLSLQDNAVLHIQLVDDYTPTAGTRYQLINYNSLVGQFAGITTSDSSVSFAAEYKDNAVVLTAQVTTPDTTPPVWEADYPQATAIAATGFTLLGKTDEAGSIYYAVLAKDSPAPTSAAVKSGTDAIKHGSAAMTAASECSCTISGLTAATDYDVYVVAEDGAVNLQTTPVKLEVKTAAIADTTPPNITAHSPAHQEDMIEVTTSTLTITFDEPVWGVAGKKIKINRVDGVTTPTVATIDVGSDAVTGQGTNIISVTLPEQTLTYEKSYNVIIDREAFKDAANNLSASYGGATQWNFTTEAIWSPNYPVLGNIREGFGGVWVDVYAHSPHFATAYCVVTQDEYAPSSQQVKDGKDRFGTALSAGHFASGAINDAVRTLQLMYLEPDSEYYVYVILEDTNGIMTLPKQLKLRTPLAAPPDTPFWNQRSPLPTVNSLRKVVYAAATSTGGKGFYALGSHGALAYSSDGVAWKGRNTYTSFDMTALTQAQAIYYAVANDGTNRSLLLSSDAMGVTWYQRLLIGNARLSGLVYAKNLLVAVADGGKIIVWRDLYSLHDYELIQLENTQNLTSITYADGTFVAVGRSGVVAASTDGYSWTAQQLGPQRHLEDVTYANGKVVAIGTATLGDTYIFCSANKGADWIARNLYTSGDFKSIMHDGTKFVTIGYGNVATSTDGETWTKSAPAGLSSHVVGAAGFAKNTFVVVGGYGGDISISTNLNDWSHVTQGVTKQLKSVAWGNSRFVAIGELGTIVTSTDGINWQAQNSGTTHAIEKVRYLDNQFVAVGSKQTILTSPDGTVWTVRKSEETSNGLLDVAYGAGKYIAVGINGAMFSSGDNGVTWTAVSLGTSPRFNAITYGGGWFAALGEYGQVYRSNDGGTTWQTSSLSDNYAQDIICLNGNRRFVAIGPSYAQYSDDAGATWTRVPHGVSSYIYSLAEKDGRLLAVGQNGSIIVSLDNGVSWTKQEFPNDINTQVRVLSGVVAGPSNFVIVGNWGLILQSTGFGPGPNLDAQAVAAAKAALTWDVIKGENLAENQILHNLTLPIMGEQGTTITWSVTPAGYVLLDGTVIRPDAETRNKDVILTAFISKGEASDTVVFNLVVKALPTLSADEAIVRDAAALTDDVIRGANTALNQVTSNLNLPAAGANGTTIAWTADPTGHINTATGAVTRPEHSQGNRTVTLTATISKDGGTSQIKTFAITIKAKDAPPPGPGPGPGPVDPTPDVPTPPQRTSVITAFTATAADRLLDRSLLDSGEASISLAALGENQLNISTAVVEQMALHDLPITLITPNLAVIIDPTALLLEQVSEWRKGKAWFEISIAELTGEELDAVADEWQLPAREGRLNMLVSIYQITLQYWEAGQESGLDISELLQAITVKHLLPEGLSEQELALLKVILAGTETGTAFSPVWLEALYDEDSGSLTFSTDRLGHFALVLLQSPTFVVDLTIDNRAGQVNGVERIMDVPPCLVGNRTLVPVRFVSEAMGAKVSWNASTRTVRIKLNGQVVELVIGQIDPAMGLDVPAQIVGNRTLVPLRFVSESLGASVRWLPATRSVEIVMY